MKLILCLLLMFLTACCRVESIDTDFANGSSLVRLFDEIQQKESKKGKEFVVCVLNKIDQPVPDIPADSNVDCYLIYLHSHPREIPHNKEMHFELIAHYIDSDIAIYRGIDKKTPRGSMSKWCLTCEAFK